MKKLTYILLAAMVFLSSCTSSRLALNEDVTNPIVIKEPKLIYPISAQEENNYGTATILFSISKEGVVRKTHVHKSSGYKDLDRAAENYCRGLLFTPALQGGEAIASNMRWEIKFNLNDFSKGMKGQIRQVKNLYKDLRSLRGEERLVAQNEILQLHEEVISKIKDVNKLNEYVYSVIKSESKHNWESVSKTYPLTFLLYHDFISRFEDNDSLYLIKSKMEYAINQDLEYLQSANNVSNNFRVNRSILIKKIKAFVQNSYPEMKVNNLNPGMKNNTIS